MHSSRLLSSLPCSICVFGDTWKFILFHFFFLFDSIELHI